MKPLDARRFEEGAVLETSVCIVGAGAAGISMANELAGAGLEVLLLESGGYEPDAATQDLYRGRNVARTYFPLESCRLRFFGGTTNHWAGVCRELDPIDFETHTAVPWSGWPIDAAALASDYDRARELCELGPEPYSLDAHPFADGLLETKPIFFSPPTRFGSAYRALLERAPNVRIVLHANAVEVELARERASVERIRFSDLDGRRFSVEARCFVLAMGGLETPRLMLASRSRESAGVGNRHDLVGRFFMEHPHVRVGSWLLGGEALHRSIYDWPDPRGGYGGAHMGLLALSAPVRRREALLGWSAELKLTTPDLESVGYLSFRELVNSLREGEIPDDWGRHVRAVFDDLEGAANGTWQKLTGSTGRDARYEITVRSEQAPNPDSRVKLGDEKDAMGMPRIDLAWRLAERDYATIHRGLEILALEVGRLGWGRVRIPEPGEEQPWTETIHGGWHQMGTTRMADRPEEGVVDRDCRVHGIENLYIAGSSVFPTGGWANPTLTLVALAVRTARHLRDRFKEGAPVR